MDESNPLHWSKKKLMIQLYRGCLEWLEILAVNPLLEISHLTLMAFEQVVSENMSAGQYQDELPPTAATLESKTLREKGAHLVRRLAHGLVEM
jgi:hypothetical protein